MILRELLVRFGLDFNAADFARANNATNSLKSAATRLVQVLAVGFIARELRDIVTDAIEAGAAIDDMARKTGVGAGAIQELRYAAKLSGLEIAQFDKGLTTVTKMAGEAVAGNKAAAESFATYGVSLRDNNGVMKTGDVFMMNISDRMKAAKSDAEKLAIATTFFGAKNAAMTILLKEGSGELAKMRQEARDLGYVMSDEASQQAEALGDNIDRLKMAAEGFRNTIAAELFPWLQKSSDAFISWIKVNRVWLAQKVKEKIEAFARGVRAAWSIVRAISRALTAFTAIVGGVGNALAILGMIFAVRLVTQIGAAIVATQAFTMAQVAAGIAAARTFALALLTGGAFLALAAVIVLLAEEIAAALDPDVDGLFEKMAGKWGEFREMIWHSMEGDHPLVIVLKMLGMWFVTLIDLADSWQSHLFGALSLIQNAFIAIPELAATVVTAIGTIITRIKEMFSLMPERMRNAFSMPTFHMPLMGAPVTSGFNGTGGMYMSPSAGASSGGNTVQNRIEVTVDANGQSFSEAGLADNITRQVSDALDTANAQTLQSLTPEFSEGTP